jgi:regulator of RNase E activity RraA
MADDPFSAARERLFTAVLSDVLDAAGRRSQAMRPGVRPLDDALVMVGRARTGLYADVYHVVPGENPYELEIALVDDLEPGEVVVLAAGASGRIAPWGELLSL